MLKKILSPQTCAACRLCCIFDQTDTWELPLLAPDALPALQSLCPDAPLQAVGDSYVFTAPTLAGDALFRCPALTDCGCGLPQNAKPLDCKIWPFRLMYDMDGRCVIAISELCRGVAHLNDDQLRQFLAEEYLEQMLSDLAQTHPEHIKPWMDGYRKIVQL